MSTCFLAVLTSCATALKEGQSVRVIKAEPEECEIVGHFKEEDLWSGRRESVLNDLRNQAAKKGANYLVIDQAVFPEARSALKGVALKCPDDRK